MIYALLFALLVQPSFSLEPIDGDPDVQAHSSTEDMLFPVGEEISPELWYVVGYTDGKREGRSEMLLEMIEQLQGGQMRENLTTPSPRETSEQRAAQRFQGMLFLIVSIGISGGALLFLVSSWWRKGPTPTNPG